MSKEFILTERLAVVSIKSNRSNDQLASNGQSPKVKANTSRCPEILFICINKFIFISLLIFSDLYTFSTLEILFIFYSFDSYCLQQGETFF